MAMQKITQEEIFEKTNNAFDFLDRQRAEGLEKTRSIQAIKNRQLKYEEERLINKYGEDHPRVKKISNRLEYNKDMFKALDREIENTKIKTPDFNPDSWMVHGRIVDETNNGIKNLTVSLFDENGSWNRKLGFACTTEQGYFSIIYTPEGGKGEYSDDKILFLTILDKGQNILYQDTEPLFISVGQIDYREIILSKENDTCSPPEASNIKSSLPTDAWIVRGIVTDEENKGIQGLTISLYDKDLLFDDALGTTLTDDNGNFLIIYRTDAFKILFEKKPDLYLKVLDNKGSKLYSSRKAVRHHAGREEYFQIKIRHKKY